MKRAIYTTVYAQGNVYWRIGAKRNWACEINETKSPQGIEPARSTKWIPYRWLCVSKQWHWVRKL